ncbi:MAG: hypothetical protein AAB368_01915, partial [bacterium]
TRTAWSPAVTGNVIVMASDPQSHDKIQLIRQGVSFAAAEPAPGPGLYVETGKMGPTPRQSVNLLDQFGTFMIRKGNDWNAVHKVASHPTLAGIDDAYLSDWGISVHGGFDSWPPGFMPLALAVGDPTPYPFTAGDGTSGMVYMLAAGTVPAWGDPAVHKRAEPPGPLLAGRPLRYVISWSNAGDGTVTDFTILDTVPAGVRYVAPSLRLWAAADAAGTPGLTFFGYARDAAGPWTNGEPWNGFAGPLVLRWVVDRVAYGRSGSITFRATLAPDLAAGAVVSNRAAAEWTAGGAARLTEAVSTTVAGRVAGGASPRAPGLVVYPNPFDPKRAAGGTLKFDGVADGAVATLYTLTGALVWRSGEARGGRLEWNGANREGVPVRGGMYLYLVVEPDGRGEQRSRGTVGVNR